jgi:hypothetical protein
MEADVACVAEAAAEGKGTLCKQKLPIDLDPHNFPGETPDRGRQRCPQSMNEARAPGVRDPVAVPVVRKHWTSHDICVPAMVREEDLIGFVWPKFPYCERPEVD